MLLQLEEHRKLTSATEDVLANDEIYLAYHNK